MGYEAVTLHDLREEYEVIVERIDGDATDYTATIRFASHAGVGMASGITIDISVSGVKGEASYTCVPKFWGNKLPEFVPALHQFIDEYWERQRKP